MDEGVPGSRCFVVCGKAITAEELTEAFSPYGAVQSVKVVREKGVAYVRYDRASSAALAMEALHNSVLNQGRGPKLKVLLAEAPSARGMPQQKAPEVELSSDPDNIPPRSRLFIVVPKMSDVQQIQDDMAQFPDLEYCKTDLAATRGVVFCKFSKSSSALKALEAVIDRGNKVAGYTVKAMLAEPKTKRSRQEPPPPEIMYGHLQNRLDGYPLNSMDPLKLQQMNSSYRGLPPGGHMGMGLHDFAAIGGLSGLGGGIGNFSNAIASNMNNMSALGPGSDVHLGAQGLSLMGGNLGGGPLGHASASPVSPNNLAGVPLSKQRLFVVVHKGVAEDAIARLFRRFPGMEYCDLKKERATGKSKGYCYINYSTPEAAAAAVEQLNGIEFPPHSGHRIKVMFAEPLGARSATSSGNGAAPGSVPPPPAGLSGGPGSTVIAGGPGSGGGPGGVTGGPGGPAVASMHSSASLPSRSPGVMSMQASTPSAHTPLSRSTAGMGQGVGPITPDTVASVSDSLAGMSLHHIAAALPAPAVVDEAGMVDRNTAGHSLTSPGAPGVSRELMFNVN